MEGDPFFSIKILSLSPDFKKKEAITESTSRLFGKNQSFLSSKDLFTRTKKIPKEGIHVFFIPPKKTRHCFKISGNICGEITIQWFEDDFVSVLETVVCRIDVLIKVFNEMDWENVKKVFFDSCESFSPTWAELNYWSATQKCTFSGLNSHYKYIPHLSSANFLGKDYLEYFGGLKKFNVPPFLEVAPMENGVYVCVSNSQSREEYLMQREKCEFSLGPPGTFGIDGIEPKIFFSEWKTIKEENPGDVTVEFFDRNGKKIDLFGNNK